MVQQLERFTGSVGANGLIALGNKNESEPVLLRIPLAIIFALLANHPGSRPTNPGAVSSRIKATMTKQQVRVIKNCVGKIVLEHPVNKCEKFQLTPSKSNVILVAFRQTESHS